MRYGDGDAYIRKSAEILIDTKYKDNWLFYNDSITLMKGEGCKDWMKAKGIFKHWILSTNDLNKGAPYYGHPIDNSPELVTLDCSIFCNMNRNVQYHDLLRSKLNDAVDKDKKFRISKTNRGLYAYLRLLAPKHHQTRAVHHP